MPLFNYSFTVDASQSVVSDFHHDTSALRKLSPPPIFAQLHHIEPMAEGSVSEFTLWFGPVPVRWRAIHSDVSVAGFTDTQQQGPLKFWQHRHQFVALDDQRTEIQETINYEHATGLRGFLTRLVFGKPGLLALFTYRKMATRRALTPRASRPEWALLAGVIPAAVGVLWIRHWLQRR